MYAPFWARVAAIAVSLGAAGCLQSAVAAASNPLRAPSPCALLTASEVSSVGVVDARRRSIPSAQLLPMPPNGTGCDWVSPTAANRDRSTLFGVAVGLWDFRTAGAAWTARWGTKAKRYAVTLCTEKAPAGSGVTLPATHAMGRIGDYACATDTAVRIAKGPYFLVVSVGAGRVSASTRNVVVKLAKKALERLTG